MPMPRVLAYTLRPLAELSVIGSYGRGGYALNAPFFKDDLPNLTGSTFLITGAGSGLGLATANLLDARGASLVLVGRSVDKLQAAAANLAHAECLSCDLADLDSVRALAQSLGDRPLAGLVHNAGLIAHSRELTREGHERTFATHVLGPFLLSHLLAENLRQANGRIVWVSSGGMYTQKFDLERAQGLSGRWDGVVAYAQHKRAQVMLSEGFARAFGPAIISNAMHPGWVDTPGVASGLPRFYRWMRPLLRTPERGADTIAWLCAAPLERTTTSHFYLDRRPRRTSLMPGTRPTEADLQALWELCRNMTKSGEILPSISTNQP